MRKDTDKLAQASPRYAQLLASANSDARRRQSLRQLMRACRERIEFERTLQTLNG